ncbi:MAG: hypothetical protein AUG44_21165 [Actinobacteria bacterium 13_1_20CM_3_71_11]|nr:MAG: hypothetical protein AUG44_21165 [Actinobacteria bacterium 13_1_20CM_3_71_11]
MAGKPERPTTVSVASGVLYLLAAVAILGGSVQFSAIAKLRSLTEKAPGLPPSGTFDLASETTVLLAAGIAGGVVVAVLATACVRGWRAAPAAVWLVGVVALLGGLYTQLDVSVLRGMLAWPQPDWLMPLTAAVTVIHAAGWISVLVSVALPSARAYFRRVVVRPRAAPGYEKADGGPGGAVSR